MAALKLSGKRAALLAEIDATPPDAYPWLGTVWGAEL